MSWPPYVVIAVGLLAPALICGAAVAAAARAEAHATAGFFEAIVIVLGVAFANLLTRLYFTGGATLLQPIGLPEAGAHVAIWLAAAILAGGWLIIDQSLNLIDIFKARVIEPFEIVDREDDDHRLAAGTLERVAVHREQCARWEHPVRRADVFAIRRDGDA